MRHEENTTKLKVEYDDNYEKEPIGGGDPYYRCVSCKRSTPEINGDLSKHEVWCDYRIKRQLEINLQCCSRSV